MTDDNIPRQLGAILDILGLDSNSLLGEDNKNAGQNRERVVSWLYRILDTLDNKTGHLLRFTALLLAAQTFLAGILVRDSQTPRGISRAVLLLLLVPALCPPVAGLHVFWVKWKFFGIVRRKSADNRDERLIKQEIWSLAEVCDKRVTYHQLTLYSCYVCVLAFLITLLLAIKVIAPFCLR
jgi:hypothetical protein